MSSVMSFTVHVIDCIKYVALDYIFQVNYYYWNEAIQVWSSNNHTAWRWYTGSYFANRKHLKYLK